MNSIEFSDDGGNPIPRFEQLPKRALLVGDHPVNTSPEFFLARDYRAAEAARRSSPELGNADRDARFFRLWLSLSVIWVVASVYLQELRTFQFWRAPILEFEAPSGQKFLIDASKTQNELTAELNAALGRESRVSSSEVEKTRAALLGVIDTAKQIISEEARRAWLATLLPPLAVLALGLCLGWIFRRFRQPDTG